MSSTTTVTTTSSTSTLSTTATAAAAEKSLARNSATNKRSNFLVHWKGRSAFLWAQVQMMGVLCIAYVGNNWPHSYPRNDNHNMSMFWLMNGAVAVAALVTMKHDKNVSTVQLLSRPQTEEWKGWMQWAFIMYHYYRAYPVYNEIRVFVSCYVWMTGFGNFLYFSKKKDFSFERAATMWLRINYFPLLLSQFIGVPMDLFYIVPLHTAAFFITMGTCYLATWMPAKWSDSKKNLTAILLCGVATVLFYETSAVNFLETVASYEIKFRFSADKYSPWFGMLSGYLWSHLQSYMNWCYNTEQQNRNQQTACWAQRLGGVALIAIWYVGFGHEQDKFLYNPVHPYVFLLPMAGWLMIRNSSKYLCALHSTLLEFMGKITLETYVLQFHVFMCHNVQHIPIVIPGSGPEGPLVLKTLNMLLCGSLFVPLAYYARAITVTTQGAVLELIILLRRGAVDDKDDGDNGNTNDKNESDGTRTTRKTVTGSAEATAPVPRKGKTLAVV